MGVQPSDSGSFSAHDPVSASTALGLGAPPQPATAPSSWPHGSSNDAVTPGGRRTLRGVTAQPAVEAPAPAAGDATAPNPRAESPAFGAALVERKSNAARIAIIGLAAALVLGAAGAVAVGRGGGATPGAAAKAPVVDPNQPATLKFIVEPTDAIIKIAGMQPHQGDGTAWSVPLDPGVVQIKVTREGHQAWETSVELSSGETKTIRVELGKMEGDANLATLALDSEPEGLTVILDGAELQQKTPFKMPLPPGPHSVAVRQNGELMWKHSFQAEAGTLHAFNPNMSEIRQKERERIERERVAQTPSPAVQHERVAPVVRAPPTPREPAGPGSTIASAQPPGPGSAAVPSGPGSAPPPGPGSAKITTPPGAGSSSGSVTAPPGPGSAKITTPIPGGGSGSPTSPIVKPAITKPAPAAVAPVVVPPNAVKRTSGDLPKISTIVRPGQEVPKSVSVKICIDGSGAVTNAQVFKITGDVASSLQNAIKSWRYTPHKVGGKGVPACFVNSFTLQK
jgi:hypothetical protein